MFFREDCLLERLRRIKGRTNAIFTKQNKKSDFMLNCQPILNENSSYNIGEFSIKCIEILKCIDIRKVF